MDRARSAGRSRGNGSFQRGSQFRRQASTSPAVETTTTASEALYAAASVEPGTPFSSSQHHSTTPTPARMASLPRGRRLSLPNPSAPASSGNSFERSPNTSHFHSSFSHSPEKSCKLPSSVASVASAAPRSALSSAHPHHSHSRPLAPSPPLSPGMATRQASMRARFRVSEADAENGTPGSATEDDTISKGGHSLRKRTRIDYNHMEHGDALELLNKDAASPMSTPSRGRKRKTTHLDAMGDDLAAQPLPTTLPKKIRLISHNSSSNNNNNLNNAAAAVSGNATTNFPSAASASTSSASVGSQPSAGSNSAVGTANGISEPASSSLRRGGRGHLRKPSNDCQLPAPLAEQSSPDGIIVQDTIEVGGSPSSSDGTDQESSTTATPVENTPSSKDNAESPDHPLPALPKGSLGASQAGANSSAAASKLPSTPHPASPPPELDQNSPEAAAGTLAGPKTGRIMSVLTRRQSAAGAASQAALPRPVARSKFQKRLMLYIPRGKNHLPPVVFPISSEADEDKFRVYVASRLTDAKACSGAAVQSGSSSTHDSKDAPVAGGSPALKTLSETESKTAAVPQPLDSSLPGKTTDRLAWPGKLENMTKDAEEALPTTAMPSAEPSAAGSVTATDSAHLEDNDSVPPDRKPAQSLAPAEPPSGHAGKRRTLTTFTISKAALSGSMDSHGMKKDSSVLPAEALPQNDASHKDDATLMSHPRTRRASTRLASAVAQKDASTAGASHAGRKDASTAGASHVGQKGSVGGRAKADGSRADDADSLRSNRSNGSNGGSSHDESRDNREAKPWEHLTPFTNEFVLYPEQQDAPTALAAASKLAAVECTEQGGEDDDATHPGSEGDAVAHEDEPRLSQADGGKQESEGCVVSSLSVDLAESATASPLELSTEDLELAEAATATTTATTNNGSGNAAAEDAAAKPLWKKRYRFGTIRDPKEFVDVIKDHKNMSTVDLFDCLACINETLSEWQKEYRFLRGIADDEENAVRRRQQDATFENRTVMALKRGNADTEVMERDFVVKGIRASEAAGADIIKQYAKKQDKLMSQIYLFEYDSRDSMVGRQDPVAQREGLQNTRLRNRPKQTLKAAEAEAADDLGGVGRRTRRRKVMDDDSRDQSRAGTPALATTVPAPQRGRRGGGAAAAVAAAGRNTAGDSFDSNGSGSFHGLDGKPSASDAPSGGGMAADGPGSLTPRRGRRVRTVKSFLSESVAADAFQDGLYDGGMCFDKTADTAGEAAPGGAGRKRRRTAHADKVKSDNVPLALDEYRHHHHHHDNDAGDADTKRPRITVVKRDGRTGPPGSISADNFYSGSFSDLVAAAAAGGGADSSRPSTASSNATAETADSNYSLRSKRRKRAFHGDESFDGADEYRHGEQDHTASQRAAKKPPTRRKAAAAAAAAGGTTVIHLPYDAQNGVPSVKRHASSTFPQQPYAPAGPLPPHGHPSHGLRTGSGAGAGAGAGGSARPILAPAPPTSGRQRTTFKIKNYTPGPVAPSVGVQAFTQVMPTTGHGGSSGLSSSRAANAAALPAHLGGASVLSPDGNGMGMGDDKDYRQMTKSEKMSHSMKTRWANGSMQAAVAKRKATLAAKKAAAQHQAAQAPPAVAAGNAAPSMAASGMAVLDGHNYGGSGMGRPSPGEALAYGHPRRSD